MYHAEAVEAAVGALLEAIGEDPQRPGIQETPQRVARMYQELLWGLEQDPRDILRTGFEEGHHEPVVLRDIPFYSLCEHHLLPFFGAAHLGYIPKGRVTGASKLVRALEMVARRLQLQERMTGQLADALYDGLAPQAVVVVLDAEHLCMSMRGVQRPGTRVVTTALRGSFPAHGCSREEFLALVQGR